MPTQDLEVEWRSEAESQALDVSLLQTVFLRVFRAARSAQLAKGQAKAKQELKAVEQLEERAEEPTAPVLHLESHNRHHHNNNNDHDHDHDESHVALVSTFLFNEDMCFPKADILSTLEQAHGYLAKRPFLRKLHTSLSCVSNMYEMASVASFVRMRVNDRTLSFAMARSRLEALYARDHTARVFAQQQEEFRARAHAKSIWCVRDVYWVRPSPSKRYQVHVLPPKSKKPHEIALEQAIIQRTAATLVGDAITLCAEAQVAPWRRPQSSGSISGRRASVSARRQSISGERVEEAGADSKLARRTRSSLLVSRAKSRKEQEELENKRRALRLQVLAPDIARTRSLGEFASAPTKKPTSAQSDTNSEATGGIDALMREQNEQLLALIEANGDVRVAQTLLQQRIIVAGFRRALDQIENLGKPLDDQWALVKTWRTIYRSHTLQVLKSLAAGAPGTPAVSTPQ